jgi:hypothetical protein
MKTIEELMETPHLCIKGRFTHGGFHTYHVYHGFVDWPGFKGTVIFGFDEAGKMEHVSVNHYNRRKLPSWEDMCRLKDMFFRPDEMVVQIHPAEKNYLHGVGTLGNRLENVLHLRRPMDGNFEILNRPEEWQ